MIWYAKMQPLSGNQLLELRTSLLKMPLVLRLPRKMHLCRSSSNLPRLPSLDAQSTPLPYETTSERPKCLRDPQLLTLLPQRRRLFRHLNFQECSKTASFYHFWLPNVLRATTACTFSTSQLPKVLRHPQFFNTFDFEMCFAPQLRALFRHLNFQKCSEPLSF